MQFLSFEFLVFFISVFAIGVILKPRIRLYKYYLLAISLFFYASWSLNFLVILIGDILINYFFSVAITESKRFKKLFFGLGILFNVIVWGYLKYYNFFIDSLFQLLNSLNIEANIVVVEVLAPLGISFFTFRIVSHLFDNLRGKLEKPSLVDFANYVSFFPQIASGPIARAKPFYHDLNNRDFKYDRNEVILLILSGIFKKYVLSSFLFDYVFGPFASPESYSALDLSLAALGYTAMIYVDFSGYSDLAIGFSKLLGFNAPMNFNLPYRAYSMRGYWRRWHMTLSGWLKDYIYIPLGGSRKGTIRKYFNLMLTMTFAGFWHGAGLNFIIWGILHGFGLIFNQAFMSIGHSMSFIPDGIHRVTRPFRLLISWIITMTFNTFTRIFFNSRTFGSAIIFIQNIINPTVFENTLATEWRFVFVTAFVISMSFWVDKFSSLIKKLMDSTSITFRFLFVIVILYIILSLGPEQVPPFVYFSF